MTEITIGQIYEVRGKTAMVVALDYEFKKAHLGLGFAMAFEDLLKCKLVGQMIWKEVSNEEQRAG